MAANSGRGEGLRELSAEKWRRRSVHRSLAGPCCPRHLAVGKKAEPGSGRYFEGAAGGAITSPCSTIT